MLSFLILVGRQDHVVIINQTENKEIKVPRVWSSDHVSA